jgi:hypothetical protein
MTRRHGGHGQNRDEILNLPVGRDEGTRGEDDHADDAEDGKGHAELEALEDFGNLDEEVGEFHFFRGGAPGHVDLEHVGEEGSGDVEGEAAEEDAKHKGPFEVHEDCGIKGLVGDGYRGMEIGLTI